MNESWTEGFTMGMSKRLRSLDDTARGRSRATTRHLRRRVWLCSPLLLLLLLSAPSSQAKWVKLSEGASFSDVFDNFVVSPDGEWVVYWQDRDGDTVIELFSAPTSGISPHRRISGLLPAGATFPQWMAVTPDSRTVVYIAEQETSGVRELFAVPIGGGSITKLNGALASGHEVKSFAISPLGDRVVYALQHGTVLYDDLYSVPIEGGMAQKLNDAVTQVISYAISPLGDRVVHHGWTGGSAEELYSGPHRRQLDGNQAQRRTGGQRRCLELRDQSDR